MRCGLAVSEIGQTGQSEAIHSRGVREYGRQVDHAGRLVYGRGLDSRNLMLTQRLAHDVEAARKRRIAKGLHRLPGPPVPNRGCERFFGVDEFRLRFGQGRGQSRNRFTAAVHV
jgi:hypothetical protein